MNFYGDQWKTSKHRFNNLTWRRISWHDLIVAFVQFLLNQFI